MLSGLIALLGVSGLCLFLVEFCDADPALLPLPVLAGSVVWLCLWGFAGQLGAGCWLWLALAAAGVVLAALRRDLGNALVRLASPGFLVFLLGSLGFWAILASQQPRFILWDEFTFWGTACKMTTLSGMLHPAAPGNLAARGSLPGVPLLSHLFQFASGGFAEWKSIAAYDTLCLAALSALVGTVRAETETGAERGRRWPRAVLLAAGAVLLPYFFTAPAPGGISRIYLTVMGDLALGLCFGGALCLWFAGRARRADASPWPLLGAAAACLGALTLIKDIGLAYAAIAAALIAADLVLAAPRLSLRGLGQGAAAFAGLLAGPAALYLGWSRYVAAAAAIDKTSVGSAATGDAVSYGFLLRDGLAQLVGKGSDKYAEKFAAVKGLMFRALPETDLCLLGSGAAALALIAAVLLAAFFTAAPGARRRVAVFGLFSAAGYAAFLLFHLFLYVYNFTGQEALVLKDYDRYIAPFYLGWLLAAFCLLAVSAESGGLPRPARLGCLALSCGILAAFCARGLPSAGFWNYPAENYAIRDEVARRAAAVNGELQPEDTVFLISQGDDATRWYYYGYELNARLATGFAGFGYAEEGADNWETTIASLVNPHTDPFHVTAYAYQKDYPFTAECSKEDLVAFLQDKRYTHLLIDESDTYIRYEFEDLFEGKAPIFRCEDAYLYEIRYEQDTVRFVPVGEVRYEP